MDGRFQVQSMPSMSQQVYLCIKIEIINNYVLVPFWHLETLVILFCFQNFNQPMPQIPPLNQQISPLQKNIQSSQELPPSNQLYPQAPVPYPQASLRQHGQPLLPPSAGPLQSQQIHGVSGQFPTSQPQTQQSALSAAFPQTPLDASMHSNTALATNQQQVPPSMTQQPLQQSPSPLAQMLSQQTQTLQASFHSSQQAFSQLQQQLQMMQPSSQALTLQQNAEATKKQVFLVKVYASKKFLI